MKILVYHSKYDSDYYLVDTPARLEAAQRQLFAQLDEGVVTTMKMLAILHRRAVARFVRFEASLRVVVVASTKAGKSWRLSIHAQVNLW
jgi:2-phospho-L-lactate guanylyltransferase (CobY/MobA/RfbA family)